MAVWRPSLPIIADRMRLFKRAKKPRPPSQPQTLGIPPHIGDVAPLGTGTELDQDTGSQGTPHSVEPFGGGVYLTTTVGVNDGGVPGVAPPDNEGGRSHASGTSTSTAERSDRITGGCALSSTNGTQ